MEMTLIIPGTPVGKGRPRVTRYGTYTPQKTRDYEALVRRCWQQQSGATFPEKAVLHASITAYFPIPKSASKKKSLAMDGSFHISRPDSDNVAKAVLDSLNGLAFPDDSAVQIDRAWKLYTMGEPHVELIMKMKE